MFDDHSKITKDWEQHTPYSHISVSIGDRGAFIYTDCGCEVSLTKEEAEAVGNTLVTWAKHGV